MLQACRLQSVPRKLLLSRNRLLVFASFLYDQNLVLVVQLTKLSGNIDIISY